MRPQVLLLESNPCALIGIAKLLEAHGFRVLGCSNESEANTKLAALINFVVDVIVIDSSVVSSAASPTENYGVAVMCRLRRKCRSDAKTMAGCHRLRLSYPPLNFCFDAPVSTPMATQFQSFSWPTLGRRPRPWSRNAWVFSW